LRLSRHYPSFGSRLAGDVFGSDYRYGFGGIEKSPQINAGFYETDFRLVDTRIGRWLSPDPIVKPWESVYASFANNPIYYVDPSGLTPTDPPSTGGTDEKKSREVTMRPEGYSVVEPDEVNPYIDETGLEGIEIILNESDAQALSEFAKSDANSLTPLPSKTWGEYTVSSGALNRAKKFTHNAIGRLVQEASGLSRAEFESKLANQYAQEAYASEMEHCEMCYDPVSGQKTLTAPHPTPLYIEEDVLTLGGATAVKAGGKMFIKAASGIFVKLAKKGLNETVDRIKANSVKEFKALVKQLSKPGSQLTEQELKEFEKLTEQYGGKLRYDLNPVKGKNLQPHVQVEGLGSSIQSRHVWLGEGVK
jgi:RHS repeat-associated protein